MSSDEELTEPVMDGAADASDTAKAAGLVQQAQQDHPSSAADLVHDLQIRARETGVVPAGDRDDVDSDEP